MGDLCYKGGINITYGKSWRYSNPVQVLFNNGEMVKKEGDQVRANKDLAKEERRYLYILL